MKEFNKYIQGTSTQEELESFSKKLIHYKLDKDRKLRWSKILKEKYSISKNKPSHKWYQNKILIFSIAASLLLPIIFYNVLLPSQINYKSYVKDEIAQLNIMSDQVVMRKGLVNIDKIRQKGTLAYVEKKYSECISIWEGTKKQNMNASDCLYLGISYLKTHNSKNAIKWFNMSKLKNKDAYFQELNWMLGLAYLDINNKVKAKEILESIITQNEFKAQKAKIIIKILNK